MNSLFNDYDAFVDKFKPKLTTDDCYTPKWIYDLVVKYVNDNVRSLDGANIVRPFWPGGDYKAYDYKTGDIVIDNPPFSICAEIVDFYVANGIGFWLWCPALTQGGLVKDKVNVTAVVSGETVTYENGAKVPTAFVTNLYPDNRRIYVAGKLTQMIKDGEKKATKNGKAELPRYELPDGVVTSARLQKIANAGIDLVISDSESLFIRALESQKRAKKALFGGGWILSREAAAREAAAREVHYWGLSEQELMAMNALGTQG